MRSSASPSMALSMTVIERAAALLELAASGALRPVIDTVYPRSDARTALAHVDGGGLVGKVLVVPEPGGG